MICWPTSVEPVNTILRTCWVVDQPLAHHRALARQDLEHPVGQARLAGQLADPDRGQRRPLGRLGDHRVAGRQRRAEPPAEDRHGEVPRHDQADDADRLLEGHVDAAGNRDLLAAQAFRRRRVVAQDVAHVARFPPGLAHRVPGVRRPRDRPAPRCGRRSRRRRRAAARPARRARPRARPAWAATARAIAASVSSADVDGTVATGLLGRRVQHCERGHAVAVLLPAQNRSKPRRSSQSVTAASNAASSTRAPFA